MAWNGLVRGWPLWVCGPEGAEGLSLQTWRPGCSHSSEIAQGPVSTSLRCQGPGWYTPSSVPREGGSGGRPGRAMSPCGRARSSLQAGGRCPGMAGPTSCDHTHGLEPRSAGGTTEHRFASSALRPPQGPWGQGCPHSARWALGLSPEAELFLVWGGGGGLVAKSCPTLATP